MGRLLLWRFHLSKAKRQRLNVATDNTVNFNDYVVKRKTIALIPKSINQETYISLLTNQTKPIVFAVGPAGTGKTMLAVLAALKAYREGQVKKLILTRPAVEVADSQQGLPPD